MQDCSFQIGDIVRVNPEQFFSDNAEGEVAAILPNGKFIIKFGREQKENIQFTLYGISEYMADFPDCLLAMSIPPEYLEKIPCYSPQTLATRMFSENYHSIDVVKLKNGENCKYDGTENCAMPDCTGSAEIQSIINRSGTVCFMPTCFKCYIEYHGQYTDC